MAAWCEAPQLLSLIFPVHVCWAAQTGAEKSTAVAAPMKRDASRFVRML